MQSMFRLWNSDAPGDKIMDKSTFRHSMPLPVVEIPALMNKLKRKSTASPEPGSPQHAHVVKKFRNAQGEGQVKAASLVSNKATECAQSDAPKVACAKVQDARPKAQPSSRKEIKSKAANPNPNPDPDPNLKMQKPAVKPESCPATIFTTTTPAVKTDLTFAQQAVEAQINYEILLKHNELRLIEQELAKCQISLEQLRRCSLVPFPGSEGLSENVSGGVGPALQPPAGYTQPQYPAPWGVTDGPYTRHYAKWLISDPKFDSMHQRALTQQSHGYFCAGEGRATRGSFAEFGSTGKARTSRTSTGTLKLQALGENPAPAPKIDPLLHKRSTDGQWVRLYCAQCGHSNFSNTQGFLNHCRIKHNQVFKSHDQAAIACGIPVDINEVGNPVSTTDPVSTTTATTTTAAAITTTSAVTFPTPSTPGFVHSLVRVNPPELAKHVFRLPSKHTRDHSRAKAAKLAFANSPSTPYLASLLKKRGFSGDLKEIVDLARTKVDMSVIDISDDDAPDSATQTPISPNPQQLVRLPVSAPNVAPASKAPSARPGSSKGQHGRHARLPPPFPPPVNVTDFSHGNGHHMLNSPVDLSPNTVESNPGLVSDHDDDDDEDGYDARSQPDIVMADDVVVEDASDVEGVAERTGSRKGLDGCFARGEGSRKH
ncbi:hypothetical protein K504DRAFT_379838 [Pleomassaria siparia CBS 279.74]|uniref:AHC1-like C2H2 zinc-finger domain-containing protein n=1 Tax=Pleomassaria siparia CBS 279.74 TaxID=1314801 RepID=A0A6G1K9H5_9PLEO|nr:hypothetical protein K504DRAFT_379838 [Pleomassaria siparia CBS 279.74]